MIIAKRGINKMETVWPVIKDMEYKEIIVFYCQMLDLLILDVACGIGTIKIVSSVLKDGS